MGHFPLLGLPAKTTPRIIRQRNTPLYREQRMFGIGFFEMLIVGGLLVLGLLGFAVIFVLLMNRDQK